MTFEEILPNFKNHEYIRRKDWGKNNIAVLGKDNSTFYYYKVYKDVMLAIIGPHALFSICEEDGYGNSDYDFLLPDILADDWEVFDGNGTVECGFQLKNLNRATEHQLLALLALEKLRKDFDNMSYDEKLKLHEKYPDLITTTN